MIRSDYVGNSNDSYWLTNARALMTGPAPLGFSPLYGKTGVEQKLRTRVGFRQLEDELVQRKHFKPEDLQRLAFANRVHAAELVLPQLLPICESNGDSVIRAACKALASWDRRAELNSRGAVLFREFWNVGSAIPGKWATPFNPADPVNTPAGVSTAAAPAMMVALKQAAVKLQRLGIALDARLGDYQDDTRNGVRVPMHGAIGDSDGSYNSIHMSGERATYRPSPSTTRDRSHRRCLCTASLWIRSRRGTRTSCRCSRRSSGPRCRSRRKP
jgi:acyl-homoserine-lactone acylase